MSDARPYSVWSDGACLGNPGPGGYAAIVLAPDGSELVAVTGKSPSSTNQRMEMTAAAEGLSKVPAGAMVTVFTDSKYVVDGMTSWIKGWKKRGWRKADGNPVANLELWKRLESETVGRNVSWKHVRGHAGIEMNERCDVLASAQASLAKQENSKR